MPPAGRGGQPGNAVTRATLRGLPSVDVVVGGLESLGFRYDPAQVGRAERKEGAFKGVAEYVFKR